MVNKGYPRVEGQAAAIPQAVAHVSGMLPAPAPSVREFGTVPHPSRPFRVIAPMRTGGANGGPYRYLIATQPARETGGEGA